MKSRITWMQLVVVITLVALAIAFAVPAIQRARARHDLTLCEDRLRQIGIGLLSYAGQGGGALPVSDAIDGPQRELLDGLVARGCLGDPRNCYCPARQEPESSYTAANFAAGKIGYFYYSARDVGTNPRLSKFLRTGVTWPRRLDTSMDPKSWVMSDIWVSSVPTAHAGYRKGVNYLMLDGSVDFVGGSPRQAFH